MYLLIGPVRQSDTIVTSGTAVDEIIVFLPSNDNVALVTFNIIDDNVGLETLETYRLSLSIVGTSDGIVLGNTARSYYSTTIISITDDESRFSYLLTANGSYIVIFIYQNEGLCCVYSFSCCYKFQSRAIYIL